MVDARAQIYADCKIEGKEYELDEILVLLGVTEETGDTPQLFVWFNNGGNWTLEMGYSYCPNFYQDITPSLAYMQNR